MSNYYLELSTNNGNRILHLHLDKHKNIYDIDINAVSNYVFDNLPYKIFLRSDDSEEFSIDSFCVNDEEIKISQNNGIIKAKDNPRIFQECYGVAFIQLEINNEQYISEPLSVMTNENNEINDSIESMTNYIYDNCKDLLYEEHQKNYIHSGLRSSSETSIEVAIDKLSEIYNTYKDSLTYFRFAPVKKLIEVEKVDSFERIISISSSAMKYIVTHADELEQTQTNSGIRYMNKFYRPKNTLSKTTAYSLNTYENRVILGFIFTLIQKIVGIKKQLNDYSKKLFVKRIGNYIESRYYIYSRSRTAIQKYKNRLDSLLDSYKHLYITYSHVFNLSSRDSKMIINSAPKFTSAFRNIGVYRNIFTKIKAWFEIENINFDKEELLLSFIKTSKIYEYFCLVRMLDVFHQLNPISFEKKRLNYNLNRSYYQNTRVNNTFYYDFGKYKYTLFFQPVVFDDINENLQKGISLFRSTRYSVKGRDRIYLPDYILKVTSQNESSYYILDAKFSNINTVIGKQLSELVYKYLFAINPVDKNSRLNGLFLLCGKDENDKKVNIHDKANAQGIRINPFVHFIGFNVEDIIKDKSNILTLILSEIQNQLGNTSHISDS